VLSKKKSAALLVLTALSLAGCTVQVNVPETSNSNSEQSTNRVEAGVSGDAFAEYQDQMTPLAEQEQSIISRYDSVSGDNYTDDLTMYTELVDMVPDVRDFIAKIEAIRPTDPEIARVHEIYVEAWNAQASGFTMTIDALEKQDIGIATEANRYLAEGRSLMRQYIQEVGSLGN
jgi:hypothetical protein